jgi:gas vesicle protein
MKDEHTDSGANGFMSGLIIGGLLGAAAALWLAPQSGAKTQQMVRRQAHRLQRRAEHTLEDVKDGAQHASEDAREKVAAARQDSQDWLETQAHQVSKTASKVHDGVAH